MPNRFENALFIQQGAVNGRAIARVLVDAYEEAMAEYGGTDAMNRDPAVQLILHQLCHLARMGVNDYNLRDETRFDYDRATQACKDRSSPEALARIT